MAKTRLDQELLGKLARKTGKKKQYVREQISRRATRRGISSQAAQILWAQEYGIGAGRFLRSLPPHIQQQVHDGVAAPVGPGRPRGDADKAPKSRPSDPVRDAVDQLLSDATLKRRCGDLLKGRGPYDRAVREATTVLDDRLKKLGQIKGYMKPVDVVGKVLNSDPQKAILKVSDERAEQDGMFSVCKGLTLAFRGPAHHTLSDDFTRADALKFCGFVDALLAILGKASKASSP